MTQEEEAVAKAAADKVIADKAIADKEKLAEEDAKAAALAQEADKLTKLEEENAKLIEERDNYKAVALKRLGKLPGDADFLGDSELSVAEQVRLALLDREIASNSKAKEEETKRIIKENAELRLAIKNRPGGSIGNEGGSNLEVKDNVFSSEQLAELTKTAIRLKADPAKFIEAAKKNFLSHR